MSVRSPISARYLREVMRMTELIVFRALVKPGAEYGINLPIETDGGKAVIRSILEVKCLSNGETFVIGKCRMLKGVSSNDKPNYPR